MALIAKPARPAQTSVDAIEAFISKGGSVASEALAEKPAKAPQHPLKFPPGDLFDRLERAREASAVKLPRNTWILQAIAEKLERDGV
ncbi:hypothetical protein [Methylobacterium oxalidis]|uniref:Uncharacterized protein n=1 Tax=Methylobacterium oxalidis TaxID=944322 RepID=A0A512J9I1_9HYPH|nr:hypothetical protein [Methylobacterium oxalidis]GEP06606.1 hypothetical protein MOX02_46440 [Methylobacterium oxalidis]GJE35409.1 hypothetical protein LDDCCGHA_5627 [Methylobacterium oxalidis]GLS66220.1 hypothetical protein GCM10007888_46020 [Methylobacterium oxalidis]